MTALYLVFQEWVGVRVREGLEATGRWDGGEAGRNVDSRPGIKK